MNVFSEYQVVEYSVVMNSVNVFIQTQHLSLHYFQGHMDEDVQAALLQIIRMRQGFVC